MVWMQNYCFYCSVRLGVLVISVLAFIYCFVLSIILFAMGLSILSPAFKLLKNDRSFQDSSAVKMLADKVENDSTSLKVVIQLYLFAHMTACVLAFYGALKLKKYLLLPIIFFEFCRIVYVLTLHIIIMMTLKMKIDLGLLITYTLMGGFFILFLGYNWAACVAFYQIINLVNSERYKSLYGEDPFNPIIPNAFDPSVTENVRVLITPPNNDIDEQKRRNAFPKYPTLQSQSIITVLPANNNLQGNSNLYRNRFKRKQNPAHATALRISPTTSNHVSNNELSILKYLNRNDNYEVSYNNWQWSELAPPTVRHKKNIYLDSKWKY